MLAFMYSTMVSAQMFRLHKQRVNRFFLVTNRARKAVLSQLLRFVAAH